MVNIGGGGGSKSKTTSTPVAYYLPGQEKFIPEYTGFWQDIWRGNMSSPGARALQTMMSESAMKSRATERSRLSGTVGMSTPARQRAMTQLGTAGISDIAQVPQQLYQGAVQYLSQYALTSPQIGTQTRATSRTQPSFKLGISPK